MKTTEKAPAFQSENLVDATDNRAIGIVALHDVDQRRAEHSRSLEDAEKYKAIETLKHIGLLIPLTDLELYHGRTYEEGASDDWSVDPYFQNGGNDSGNANVHNRPSLYTGDLAIAQEFAERRKMQRMHGTHSQKQIIADVRKIESRDPDAVVLDTGFVLSDLEGEDLQAYMSAMQALVPRVSSVPVEFGNGGKFPAVRDAVNVLLPENYQAHGFAARLTSDDIPMERGSLEESVVGSVNARLLLIGNPMRAVSKVAHHTESIIYENGENHTPAPINTELITHFMEEAHVVGVKTRVRSATVRKTIDIVSLLDLPKVNTPEQYAKQRRNVKKLFGSMAEEARDMTMDEKLDIANVLDNAYATPQALVEAAKKVPGFSHIFEADAGNKEGFTLEEHVETVLRNFDENFADKLPVALLKPLRLAIIAHDIGKPIAAAKGENHRQKEYNFQMAQHFFKEIGLDESTGRFLVNMIGDGMALSSQAILGRHRTAAAVELQQRAAWWLQDWLREVPSDDTIMGFIELEKLLVTCDGGAYTTMAVTRKEGGVDHRNVGSFDVSFKTPANLTRSDLSFRR